MWRGIDCWSPWSSSAHYPSEGVRKDHTIKVIIKWKGNKLAKAKQRILDFTSLFRFHLMIIYIIFAHTSLYVMVLQVGKMRFSLTQQNQAS